MNPEPTDSSETSVMAMIVDAYEGMPDTQRELATLSLLERAS
jgi:hypothetical protein